MKEVTFTKIDHQEHNNNTYSLLHHVNIAPPTIELIIKVTIQRENSGNQKSFLDTRKLFYMRCLFFLLTKQSNLNSVAAELSTQFSSSYGL